MNDQYSRVIFYTVSQGKSHSWSHNRDKDLDKLDLVVNSYYFQENLALEESMCACVHSIMCMGLQELERERIEQWEKGNST